MSRWDDDAEFYADIARQVVARRQMLRLSQRELAELCGTTQSAIARFESSTRPPKLDTLLRLASALDCELDVRLRPRTSPTSPTTPATPASPASPTEETS